MNEWLVAKALKTQRGVVGVVVLLCIIVALGFASVYVVKLNDIITTKFEGKRWDIPAKVYASPLKLYMGAPVNAQILDYHLQALGYRSGSFSQSGSYLKQGSTYTVHTRNSQIGGTNKAAQIFKVGFSEGKVSRLQTTEQVSAPVFSLEPIAIGGIYPNTNEDRVLISLDQVPKPLIQALIATEDRDFYQHHGVSVRGTARAFVSNLRGGRQGGSTITQQLIKNFYLNSERSLKRKANEAVMALLLEMHYSKDEILQAYLNEINLGQNGNRSINGFALAARFYFDRPLAELSVDQMALLVGVAKGPSLYNPWRNPENALSRRNQVLANMVSQGYLSDAEFQKLSAKPLAVVASPRTGVNRFPDFLDVVQDELKQRFDADELMSDGLSIMTTLDPVLQETAKAQFDAQIKKLRKGKAAELQGALVAADPQNGELKAVVGGYGTFTGYNRALKAKRQIGSLVKPFVYLTAFESGRFNLYTPLDDSALTLQVKEGSWTPQNYDKQQHGATPLVKALAQSYNLATVRLGLSLSLSGVQRSLQRFDLSDQINPYPSVLLGAVDSTPMQVLQAYQVIAGSGFSTPLHTISKVVDPSGQTLQQRGLDTRQVTTAEAAFLTNTAMQQVVSNGTAKSLASLGERYNLAGKTGTTNDYKDAWFAGFSGNLATVVWVGLDDNKPMGLSGSSGALPVFKAFMQSVPLSANNPARPSGVEFLWLDQSTGYLSDKRCPGAVMSPVIYKFAPKKITYCAQQMYYLDQNTAAKEFTDLEPAPFDGDPSNLPGGEPKPERGLLDSLSNVFGGASGWFN